jgi:hypothetical protein
VESVIRAGALDGHALTAFGVEEKRCTPAITQFTRTVDCRMIRRDESKVEGVAATERSGDFSIAANRIAFARKVRAECGDQVEDDA